jgi:hypothetical protein
MVDEKKIAACVAKYGQDIGKLIAYFGRDLGMRVYACAMIAKSDTDKLDDTISAIRYTIGCLKRIRRTGFGGLRTYAEAVEMLEIEQTEGRHYKLAMPSKLARECADIASRTSDSYTRIRYDVVQEIDPEAEARQARKDRHAMAMAMLMSIVEADSTKYANSTENAGVAREWIVEYWQTLSTTKRKRLTAIVKQYMAGNLPADTPDYETIRKNYAPKGVPVNDFLELIVRYAM